MDYKKTTKIVVIGTTLGLILWDIVAYVFGHNATISVFVTDLSYYTPWVPFVLGALVSHWIIPARGSRDP